MISQKLCWWCRHQTIPPLQSLLKSIIVSQCHRAAGLWGNKVPPQRVWGYGFRGKTLCLFLRKHCAWSKDVPCGDWYSHPLNESTSTAGAQAKRALCFQGYFTTLGNHSER